MKKQELLNKIVGIADYFDEQKMEFSSRSFSLLLEVKDNIILVMPDIVEREILAHIQENLFPWARKIVRDISSCGA